MGGMYRPDVRKLRVVKSRVQKGRFKVQGQGAEVHKVLKWGRTCGPWAVQNRWGAQSGKVSVSLREIVVFEVPGHLPGCPGRGAEASRDHLLEPGRAREGTGVNFRYEKVVQNGFFDQLRMPKRDEGSNFVILEVFFFLQKKANASGAIRTSGAIRVKISEALLLNFENQPFSMPARLFFATTPKRLSERIRSARAKQCDAKFEERCNVFRVLFPGSVAVAAGQSVRRPREGSGVGGVGK